MTSSVPMTAVKWAALVLLDLSAAFDTADHDILLSRLKAEGVKGTALSWFRSYLSGRSQVVSSARELYSSGIVTYGVLRGSVLGPLLFCFYTRPLEQVIKRRTSTATAMQMTHKSGCHLIHLRPIPLSPCLTIVFQKFKIG